MINKIRVLIGWILTRYRNLIQNIRGSRWRILILLWGGKCSGRLKVEPGLLLKYPPYWGVKIGRGVFFGRNVTIDLAPGGLLQIGDGVIFTKNIILGVSESVEIGDNVLIAEFVSIRDDDHGTQSGILD